MMSQVAIDQLSREMGNIAQRSKQTPFVPEKGRKYFLNSGVNIPNFGAFRPAGWKLEKSLFVDKTGVDKSGPAMRLDRFLAELDPEYGYAVIEEGPCQVRVGVFSRD